MMRFLLSILSLALLASPVLSCQPAGFRSLAKQAARDVEKESGNANAYMDLVLNNVNQLLPASYPVPDFSVSLIDMKDCEIIGLDNGLKRLGDATFVTVEDTAKFTCALTTGPVSMSCRWKFGLMRGSATGTIDTISISSGISWKLTSGNSPQLTEFRVTELSDIKTDIKGLTPLFNWLAEDIAEIIMNNYVQSVTDVIEVVVSEIFQQVLDLIVLP